MPPARSTIAVTAAAAFIFAQNNMFNAPSESANACAENAVIAAFPASAAVAALAVAATNIAEALAGT
jgi:hypothetical protein